MNCDCKNTTFYLILGPKRGLFQGPVAIHNRFFWLWGSFGEPRASGMLKICICSYMYVLACTMPCYASMYQHAPIHPPTYACAKRLIATSPITQNAIANCVILSKDVASMKPRTPFFASKVRSRFENDSNLSRTSFGCFHDQKAYVRMINGDILLPVGDEETKTTESKKLEFTVV